MQRKISWKVSCLSVAACFGYANTALAEEWQVGNFNLLTDFVYMQRYHVKNNTLVVDSAHPGCHHGCASNKVLDAKNLVHGFKPGARISFSYLPDVKSAYELGGLYLWQMDNTDTKHGEYTLSFPFKNPAFATNFTDANRMTARYRSRFYTGELNYWRTFGKTRHDYLTLLGVVGLRYANVAEDFNLDTYKGPQHSSYDITTRNSLIGMQVGFDFQIHPTRRFYWDLLVKAGLDLNRISSTVFLGNLNNTVTLRNYTKEHVQGGMFAEAAAGIGCQLLDWLNMHAGYQMLFFGGLALAPDQLSYSSNKLSHSSTLSSFSVSTNGYIIVHGIYAGMTFSF